MPNKLFDSVEVTITYKENSPHSMAKRRFPASCPIEEQKDVKLHGNLDLSPLLHLCVDTDPCNARISMFPEGIEWILEQYVKKLTKHPDQRPHLLRLRKKLRKLAVDLDRTIEGKQGAT